ncbi:protein aurora borealis isoform X2 [Cimex lectularius]|uniref:Protein aurora borealis n=1 Tax=Cimex lectularius TaxID=79782 RepID=A0A8I6TDV7_CIMLE|nr:protein aurora borealis isoform X2 [Cimex lectularius]
MEPSDDLDSPMKIKYSSMNYCDSPKTSLLFAAQSRSFDNKSKRQLKKVVNPFVPRVQSLEKDTCSPTLFVISQSPKNEEFSWNIDDISKIQPAVIESPQYITLEYDEKTETKAQEVIEKYFSETHSIVSPINSGIGHFDSSAQSTPCDINKYKARSSSPAVSSTPCAKFSERRRIIKVDAAEQTDLSLPPVLPPDIEAILKPYFRTNNCDNVENEENMNNSTLRRKLFVDKDNETLSPVKASLAESPPLEYSVKSSRINWSNCNDKTDVIIELSSPDLSPINSKSNNESFASVNTSLRFDNKLSGNHLTHNDKNELICELLAEPLGSNHCGIFNSTTKTMQKSMCNDPQDTGYSTMDDLIFH